MGDGIFGSFFRPIIAFMINLFGIRGAVHVKDLLNMFSGVMLGFIGAAFIFARTLIRVKINDKVDAAFTLARIQGEAHIKPGIHNNFTMNLRLLMSLMWTALFPNKTVVIRDKTNALFWAWLLLIAMVLFAIFGLLLATHTIAEICQQPN
ncbi:hypothetical protein [Paenibacillus hexagrammi]|uniref:Uncharacterized protein n=1 Tax=Paenibacillus hexagrammi TaxID=2908839 RepID=A0ABY3STZ2_9BACL|nr:hypothetical protein [Paenibacillus sp. YPD9-1]UJF36606.1 hypothetical protein L0M14_30420 [Paenibacillus sp. YPD9-1]